MTKIAVNKKFQIVPCENQERICAKAVKNLTNGYLEVTFTPDMKITGEEYVLFPACCYKGNQFTSLKREYPPMFTEEEARAEMEVTITDVPRLEKDGSGSIQVTTGEVSVPCVGIYSAKEKKAVFVYTIQQINGKNLGLSYEKGKIGITWPHMRTETIYRWPFMQEK